MGFHGFSWEMVWLRFPAICFIDGGMQPLLQAMILKACKSVSKSVLLLVNQDLALKTSSFFHWYSCWKFSWGYFNLFQLQIIVSWPYSQSFQLLASCCRFHEHHHWHLQEILQLGHQSASRLSLRELSTELYFQVMSSPWKILVYEYVLRSFLHGVFLSY